MINAKPEFKHRIVLDIETTGLEPVYGDQVTCICAKDLDTGKSFKLASDDERVLLNEFDEWFSQSFPTLLHETHIITVNGRSFDIPFLFIRNQEILPTFRTYFRLTKTPHLDLCTDITDKRISLNNLAKLYGLDIKTASGKQAIEWFKQGKFKKIEDYCWADVLLTEKVYKTYMKLTKQSPCIK